jgi:broad specificity phosphatase PhoE
MIYFVRHGESQANVDHVFAGISRPAPLTERGRQQARLAGQRIIDADIRIGQIVSSPLERAYDTAAIIAGSLGLDPSGILLDARLIEYDVGALSGESTHEVTAAQLVGAPGAEDPAVFQTRVKAALTDAARSPGNVLMVSHGGVGQMIEASGRGLDPARFFELASYPNGHVIELGDENVVIRG